MKKTQNVLRNSRATRKEPDTFTEVPLRQSCPTGLTKDDLEHVFTPETIDRFNRWMCGQTAGLCQGKKYVYKWQHGEFCMQPHGFYQDPGHKADDPFTWACDQVPGSGRYQATACSGLPEGTPVEVDAVLPGHGLVVYLWDVEAFILGLPVTD